MRSNARELGPHALDRGHLVLDGEDRLHLQRATRSRRWRRRCARRGAGTRACRSRTRSARWPPPPRRGRRPAGHPRPRARRGGGEHDQAQACAAAARVDDFDPAAGRHAPRPRRPPGAPRRRFRRFRRRGESRRCRARCRRSGSYTWRKSPIEGCEVVGSSRPIRANWMITAAIPGWAWFGIEDPVREGVVRGRQSGSEGWHSSQDDHRRLPPHC